MAFFTDLQRKYALPHTAFYRYHQLHHVLQTQFGVASTKFSDYPLIRVIQSQGPKGLISTVYSQLLANSMNKNPLEVRTKWQLLIPDLSDKDCEHVSPIQPFHQLLITNSFNYTWYISHS